jgi:protocatechuate 4,5-dioxygenase beta chain
MRGALDPKVEEVYRFYTVPASNTAVGHIILENRKRTGSKRKVSGAARHRRAAAPARHRNVRRGK